MNVFSLTAALVWAAVACFVVRRLEMTVRHAVAYWSVSRERVAELHAPDSAIEAAKITADAMIEVARLQHPYKPSQRPGASEIKLPDDLEAHVNTWGDEWARDDERGNLRAKFLEFNTGDADETWQRVRRAVGVGEMPA